MTGWGQDGPRSKEAGHDLNYIAVTGVLHTPMCCNPLSHRGCRTIARPCTHPALARRAHRRSARRVAAPI